MTKSNIRPSSFASDVYNGTAGFGAVMADLKAVLGCIVGLILIVLGFFLVFMKVTRSASLTATVSDVTCTSPITTNNNIQFNCNYTATYTLDHSGQTISITTTSVTKPANGSSITLYYNPNDHTDISSSSGNYHVVGWVCVGLGILVAVSFILWAYLANRYKAIGAAEGVISGVGLIKNSFR